ncbi:hypothetical protein PG997_001195 [Apiospora hydei]|uniref:Peptidase M13 C-terminal domain-containing protein n=1 Tax=Apiospora hydei TaxID=1337664 RepID=A0ABR1XCT4_9PEZI
MADPDPPETSGEATPLLDGRREAQDQEAGASSEDSIQTDQQIKTWRRRRWASFVASIILLVAFGPVGEADKKYNPVLSRFKGKEKMAASLCMTPECLEAANGIIAKLSPNYTDIDACTHFDAYACGGFYSSETIPKDRPVWSPLDAMAARDDNLMRYILESPYPRESNFSANDKDLAIEKVHNVDAKIGYPTGSPEVMSPDALKRWYSNLNVTNSLFDNSISAKMNDVNRTWSALGKPVDRNHWQSKAYEVNAYHYQSGNEMTFPAGIMQTPQLHVDWPLYLSYGGFGFIAGHELTHAFDNNGRCFDQHRNYTDWWTNHTKEEFSKRADCFVDQYGHFNVNGPQGRTYPVDGALTLNENIADAGGVTPAYAAWKQRQGEKPDQNLPGLDFFTHDQLFHIALAQGGSSANILLDAGWCQKARDETAALHARFNVHSPPFARILGTLANQRSFLEAFDCPRKQPTCQLW